MSTRISGGTRAVSAFVVVMFAWLACASAAEQAVIFDGKDLAGWAKPAGDWQVAAAVKLDPANPKAFSIEAGSGVLVNGPKGRTINLLTEQEFGDCEAHIEFCVPKDSNSGVYFLGRYEVQILDSFGKKELAYGDCGGIYRSCSDPKPDSEGTPPRVNASKPPGEWQTFDVVFRAPRFDAAGKKTENARFIRVVQNGVVIHENVESPRPTCAARWLDEKPRGPLMLQGDHGPVAFRNLRVRPL